MTWPWILRSTLRAEVTRQQATREQLVSQHATQTSVLNREIERRRGDVAFWRAESGNVNRVNADLLALLKTTGDAHERQIKTLVEHLAPEKLSSTDDGPLTTPPLTEAQIRAMPVSGKREMFLREAAAIAARERDDQERVKAERERRDQLIKTEEEKLANRGEFDSTLGIFQDKEATEINHGTN